MNIWEFSLFLSLGIGTRQIKLAASLTVEDGQKTEDANKKKTWLPELG